MSAAVQKAMGTTLFCGSPFWETITNEAAYLGSLRVTYEGTRKVAMMRYHDMCQYLVARASEAASSGRLTAAALTQPQNGGKVQDVTPKEVWESFRDASKDAGTCLRM